MSANLPINTVLLLEDEPFISMDMEDMLATAGVPTIVSFATCAEADAWLAFNTPDFAIIDPNLKDGFSASAAQFLTARKVPFIVFSGDAQSACEKEPAFGAGTWLPKPCLPDTLFDTIKIAVSGR